MSKSKKTKFSFEQIGKFSREVCVVVIGVAITLSASYWITNRNEKSNMALFLNAIKLELEENIKILDETNETFIQPGVRYMDYLIRSHDKHSLNLDSLKFYGIYYGGTIYNCSSITFKANAFEMLKTSGYMRLVDRKELLLSIWDTYSILAEMKEIFDKYSDIKTEESRKYFNLYGNRPSDDDILKHPPLYDVYVNLPIPHIHNYNYIKAKESLEKTLSMFE